MNCYRGIALDGTQIGFYGTHQEVLQQLHEKEEGRAVSQRWIQNSPLLEHRIRQGQSQIPDMKNMKKNTLESLACSSEKQIDQAIENSALHMLAEG